MRSISKSRFHHYFSNPNHFIWTYKRPHKTPFTLYALKTLVFLSLLKCSSSFPTNNNGFLPICSQNHQINSKEEVMKKVCIVFINWTLPQGCDLAVLPRPHGLRRVHSGHDRVYFSSSSCCSTHQDPWSTTSSLSSSHSIWKDHNRRWRAQNCDFWKSYCCRSQEDFPSCNWNAIKP